MHRSLCISEILGLILDFVECWDDLSQPGPRPGRETLASLARTCHFFSSPALDVLWRDLYSFEPLLNIFPIVSASLLVDGTHWLTFCNYTERVKSIRYIRQSVQVTARITREFVPSLQYWPRAYLPVFPNVTELDWSSHLFSTAGESNFSMLEYFIGPAVTTFTLTLRRLVVRPSTDLAVFADLPKLCPDVTSFTLVPGISWDGEASKEVGKIVTQWPRLRTLRACAIGQSAMDQLLTHRTLEVLSIECRLLSPIYNGRIPDTVRELSLDAETPLLFTRFLKSAFASPTKFSLLIGMTGGHERQAIEEMFSILPSRLDTSRLLSLTIRPRPGILALRWWHALTPREPLVSTLVEFTALRELDLDSLCTVQISDADYARMTEALPHLRSLKLGTRGPSSVRSCPAATIGAVIAVLTHCEELKTFHIVFDASVPPREPPCQGWGVSNRLLTTLNVGHSPVCDATIDAIASCFKSVMPCLVQIERNDRDKEWGTIQDTLKSCLNVRFHP